MNFCRLQWLFVALIIVLGSVSMLASCGQRGDLYLPQDAPERPAQSGNADVPRAPAGSEPASAPPSP